MCRDPARPRRSPTDPGQPLSAQDQGTPGALRRVTRDVDRNGPDGDVGLGVVGRPTRAWVVRQVCDPEEPPGSSPVQRGVERRPGGPEVLPRRGTLLSHRRRPRRPPCPESSGPQDRVTPGTPAGPVVVRVVVALRGPDQAGARPPSRTVPLPDPGGRPPGPRPDPGPSPEHSSPDPADGRGTREKGPPAISSFVTPPPEIPTPASSPLPRQLPTGSGVPRLSVPHPFRTDGSRHWEFNPEPRHPTPAKGL